MVFIIKRDVHVKLKIKLIAYPDENLYTRFYYQTYFKTQNIV